MLEQWDVLLVPKTCMGIAGMLLEHRVCHDAGKVMPARADVGYALHQLCVDGMIATCALSD